ncbi:MAG: hypothetical protein AB7E72_09270 [Lysobacterales bacterium]
MNREPKPSSLPPRLLRALWIWLALTPLVALLPRSSTEAVGLLAHPVFWCALLPALALLPYLKQILPGPAIEAQRRTRRPAGQARRRARAQRSLRVAA